MSYEVQKGIPMPGLPPGRTPKYPFREMLIGDSFLVTEKEQHKVRNAALQYARRMGLAFSVRKNVDGAYRCWRIQ